MQSPTAHRHKWFLVLPITIFLSLLPFAVNAAFLQIAEQGNHTGIYIGDSTASVVKLLNFSPSNKILVKARGSSASGIIRDVNAVAVPQKSALMAIRTTPIDSITVLTILELAERLPFRISHLQGGGLKVELEDSAYSNDLENYYRKGLYFQRKGDLKSALNYYRKIVFQNRKHPYAYYKAGQIRFQWKQYRLAEINFRHALDNKCDSLDVLKWMATLYRASGREALAETYQKQYSQAVENRKRGKAGAKAAEPEEQPIQIKLVDNDPRPSPNPVAEPESPALAAVPSSYKKRYLIGGSILIPVIFWGIWLWLSLLYKRQTAGVSPSENDLPWQQASEWEIASRKQKVLNLAQTVLQEKAAAENLDLPQAQEPIQREFPLEDAGPVDSWQEQPDLTEKDWLSENKPPSPFDIAKNLNLGVGEIELALNLSSRNRHLRGRRDVRSQIVQLYNQHLSIPDIARQVNLGQNEVELFLQFSDLAVPVEK